MIADSVELLGRDSSRRAAALAVEIRPFDRGCAARRARVRAEMHVPDETVVFEQFEVSVHGAEVELSRRVTWSADIGP
jgi:hypothetical protein